MKIIGIHGKARSGKDELASILCDTYGFELKKFGDEVKKLAVKYFGLTYEKAFVKRDKKSRLILQGIGSAVRNFREEIVFANMDGNIDKMAYGESGFPLWVEEIGVDEFKIEERKINTKGAKTLLGYIYDMFIKNMDEFNQFFYDSPHWEYYWIDKVFSELKEDGMYVISDVRFKKEKEAIVNCDSKMVRIFRTDKPDIEAGADHISEIDLDQDDDWDYVIENPHKKDWREVLVLEAGNFMRELVHNKFFTEEEMKKFKINVL